MLDNSNRSQSPGRAVLQKANSDMSGGGEDGDCGAMIVPFTKWKVKENLYLWSAEPGEMEIMQLHCAATCDTHPAAGLSRISFNCPLPS